jgi:hypothetical protein
MMKVNDFLKYEITLSISYEDYFRLIYDNKYLIEARLGPERTFVAKKSVYGNSRKKAVHKAVQWFWKDFKGVLGPAHKIMTVADPHEEVVYDDSFACNDLGNKYLDDSTIIRLLDESHGELARDESDGSENHPPNSVKRIKRRRKQNVQLTSRLSQSPGGTIYYRMTEMPESDSVRPKSKAVKLASKSLDKALKEVSRRGLDKFDEFESSPKSKKTTDRKEIQAA